jgi:hypothetical protein
MNKTPVAGVGQIPSLRNHMPVTRPLNVRGSGIGRFAAGVRTHVRIFIPMSMPVREGQDGAATMPRRNRGGIDLRLADISLFRSAAIERNFRGEGPAFIEHDKLGWTENHRRP